MVRQIKYNNERPRDSQNLFATTRFRYIEVLFHDIFHYYWVKKIVRFTEDFVIIDVCYIEVPLAGYIAISGKEGAVQKINYQMMFSGNVFLIH